MRISVSLSPSPPPLPPFLFPSSIIITFCSSFFGNFGFNFGGDGGDGHREIPRGGTITLDFEVSLEDLYIGSFIELARYKAVPKAASGTRKCNCRTEMRTVSMGPGRFQVRKGQVRVDAINEFSLYPLFPPPPIPPGFVHSGEQEAFFHIVQILSM